MKPHGARLWPLAAALLLVTVGSAGMRASETRAADDTSPWDGDVRSAVRLIAGMRGAGETAPFRAGIEIRLEPGWHTYWRYPGDAGVPPRFDFAESQNLKAAEVLWPAPHRLEEAGLSTIGYERDLILPLRVIPENPRKPVALHVKLDYAICEKLCVPAESNVALVLAGRQATQDARLTAAEARVPRKAVLGAHGMLAIRAIHREDGTDRPRVLVDVEAPPGTAVDLFAEGPTQEWAPPLPVRVDGAPSGQQRFALDLDGAPPGATYTGASLNLTAVTDSDAIEVPIHLD